MVGQVQCCRSLLNLVELGSHHMQLQKKPLSIMKDTTYLRIKWSRLYWWTLHRNKPSLSVMEMTVVSPPITTPSGVTPVITRVNNSVSSTMVLSTIIPSKHALMAPAGIVSEVGMELALMSVRMCVWAGVKCYIVL